MAEPALDDFDFDEWAALAERDPEAFEARRAELVDRAIAQAGPDRRERLRRLQWRIDQVRARSGTPLAACIKLSDMMWDSVMGERGLLEWLNQIGQLESEPVTSEPHEADILPFRRR